MKSIFSLPFLTILAILAILFIIASTASIASTTIAAAIHGSSHIEPRGSDVADTPFCREKCWSVYFECRELHCRNVDGFCIEFCEEAVVQKTKGCRRCGLRGA